MEVYNAGAVSLVPYWFFILLIHNIDSACLVTCSQGSLQCQDESAFLYPFKNISATLWYSQKNYFTMSLQGQDNPKHQYRLRDEWIESCPDKKDSWVLVQQALHVSQYCALAAQKAYHALGYIKRGVASRLREMILSSYSALWDHTWSTVSFPKKDIDLLKCI